MEYALLIIIAAALCLLLSPYLLAFFLKGVVISQRLKEEIQKKKGMEKTVSTWVQMSPEQRMDATLKTEQGSESKKEPTSWLESPPADAEIRMMNEKAYKSGLVHPPVGTKFEEEKKE